MRHSGVVVNILEPASESDNKNILIDVDATHPGHTLIALTVSSLDEAKQFFADNNIPLTGSFSFKGMSAIFVRNPDPKVIELDAYDDTKTD